MLLLLFVLLLFLMLLPLLMSFQQPAYTMAEDTMLPHARYHAAFKSAVYGFL